MIKDIQLKDFIAHRDTKLGFGKGITVFVGHNGSGKSSIIDAITFALFGEHTRGKSKKNLVRRGANQSLAQICFTLNSREFQVSRGLNGAGTQSFSQLTLVSDGDKVVNKLLAGGERKQFGEYTKKEVEKVLGLDYEKMRVAAVVQQGELVRIVEAQPREFKELLNGLIGIDRLDSAYETMREVIGGFREKLRDETGYTDEEIPSVEKIIDEKERELKQTVSLLAEYEDEKRLLENKIDKLEKEIERLEPMSQQAKELQNKERQLVRYVNEKRGQMDSEISRLDRIAREARGSLQVLKDKDEVDMRLQMVKAEVEEVESKMQENESMAGKLRGFLECASKIRITDTGLCPVCNSPVSSINQMFDIKHIQLEIGKLVDEKSKLQMTKVELKKEEAHLSEASKKIAAAEKLLSSNSIRSATDVEKIEADVAKKKNDLSNLPKEILKVEDPMQLAIDGISTTLAEEIAMTRENVKSFSPAQYNSAKEEKGGIVRKLEDTNRKIGAYQHTIEAARKETDFARDAIEEVRRAIKFAKALDKIRSMVFNRDGMVGMSLRSWALAVISRKATEYASLFNIGI